LRAVGYRRYRTTEKNDTFVPQSLPGEIACMHRYASTIEAYQDHSCLAQGHEEGRIFNGQIGATLPIRNVDDWKIRQQPVTPIYKSMRGILVREESHLQAPISASRCCLTSAMNSLAKASALRTSAAGQRKCWAVFATVLASP
jgi:hypothetical protein